MLIIARALAWLLVAGVIFSTLSPIGLRPHLASPDIERFAAYLVMGVAMACAYPRHFLLITCAVAALSLSLELAQLIVPSRDGRAADAMIKLTGGVVGVGLGKGLAALVARHAPKGGGSNA